MPLSMYDITIDEEREITQADVDQLTRTTAAFGMYRVGLNILSDTCMAVARGEVAPFDIRLIFGEAIAAHQLKDPE